MLFEKMFPGELVISLSSIHCIVVGVQLILFYLSRPSPVFFPQSAPVMQVGEGQQVQIVQAAAAQGQAQTAQAQGQTMQVMQQIITNTGEIQQIPVINGSSEKKRDDALWGRFDDGGKKLTIKGPLK